MGKSKKARTPWPFGLAGIAVVKPKLGTGKAIAHEKRQTAINAARLRASVNFDVDRSPGTIAKSQQPLRKGARSPTAYELMKEHRSPGLAKTAGVARHPKKV